MSPPGKSAGSKPGTKAEKAASPTENAPDETSKPDPPEAGPPRAGRRLVQIAGAMTAVGATALFLLMSHVEQLPHGALFGLVALLVTVAGSLGLAGLWQRDPDALPVGQTVFGQLEGEPAMFALGRTLPAAMLIAILGALMGGYDAMTYVVIAALLALVPSALRRPGVMTFVIVGAIYLPFLGTWSLWDPWETHYGEVAREIIARDDWISLWWAQENWFWSKPIAIFWSEAFWLSALDVNVSPDANPPAAEWAIRLPVVSVAMAAVMTVYATMKRIFSARAGVLAALVLATAPHFFFLSHQAITDMYLVGNLIMAVCMLVLAFNTDAEQTVKRYRVLGADFSLQHVVIGALLFVVIPQALYLISRNVEFYPLEGFHLHADQFLYGSAGNAGVPGNAEHRMVPPHIPALQPAIQGAIWLAILIVLVVLTRRERRAQPLYMYAFYMFCAAAFMGKGIPGLALPGLVALFYLLASRRWRVMFEGQLRILPGILVVMAAGLPWYVAMFVRHGPGFSDRLLIHDHINRLAQGVHGDTGSVQYFLLQLGYATFPWVGLVPAAVLAWLWYQRSNETTQRTRRETVTLIGLWFFAAFTLFSAMITKFHHYIFPAVPPAMILVGILLDRMWGQLRSDAPPLARYVTVAAVVAPMLMVLGIAGLWGDVRGVIPEEVPVPERADWVLEHGWNSALCYVLVFVGAGLLVWCGRWLWQHRAASETSSSGKPSNEIALSVAVGAGAMLVAFVARDLSWITDQRPHGFERLIHLFVYNYGRPWPDHFDYRPIMSAIAVVAGLLFFLAALRWSRPVAARAMIGLSIIFSAWTLNVYMVDLSPHWGMGPLFRKYYEVRESAEEPVIAWQMNWKGENFYTGNRVFAFVDLDNVKIREWMNNNKGNTAYFVFEHTRLSSFRSLMSGKEIEEITNKRDNNKFILVKIAEL